MTEEQNMKPNRFATFVIALVGLSALAAMPALAQSGAVENGHAIVAEVDVEARTIVVGNYEYSVTSTTEFLNEVGMPGQMSDLEAMSVFRGVPDRETGSKIYFEADFDHRLLKLHIVDEIPG